MSGVVDASSPELINMEPHKCEEWSWVHWDDIIKLFANNIDQLFDPMINFIAGKCKDGNNDFLLI